MKRMVWDSQGAYIPVPSVVSGYCLAGVLLISMLLDMARRLDQSVQEKVSL